MNSVSFECSDLATKEWLMQAANAPAEEIAKGNDETRAWKAAIGSELCFVKSVPTAFYESRALKEIAIAGVGLHAAIVPLRRVIRCADGALLISPYIEGETLASPEARERFYTLPIEEKRCALATIFDALAAIANAGWVLVDCYEGNIAYDYERQTPWLFDFDLYERGNGFALAMERNYGARRLMAPEEFQKGSWIDQRTNVFNLGRIARLALNDINNAVLAKATDADRLNRYETIAEFAAAFSDSFFRKD